MDLDGLAACAVPVSSGTIAAVIKAFRSLFIDISP
jgi:hypothetical protein